MPRVPLPSVSPQVQQPVQYSAPAVTPMRSAAGDQIQAAGAAQQAIGGGMIAIGERLKNHFDLAQAKRGDNAAEEVIRSKLTGYLQKFGPAAGPDARKQLFDEIEQGVRDIETGLQSPEQKSMFRSSVDERLHSAALKADEHFARQVFAFELAESKVRAEGFVASASNEAPGSEAFEAHKANAIQEIGTIANRLGFPEDSAQRKELLQNATTTIHSHAIASLLKTGDVVEIDRAKEHLAAANAAGEIATGALPELQDDIKRARTKWEVKSGVDAVFAYAFRAEDQEGAGAETLAQQQDAAYVGLAKVAQQYGWDDEAKHAATTALGKRFDMLQESETAQKNELWTAVENTLLDPENRDMAYEDLPGPIQRGLEKFGLKDRALALARGDARSDPTVLRDTNRLTDDDLRKMPASVLQTTFSGLSKYAREDLTSRWRVAQGTAPPDEVGKRLDLEMLERYAKEEAFGGVTKDDEEKWRLLEERVTAEWTRAQAKTHAEKKAVLDAMLLDKVTLDRSWLRGDTRRAYKSLTADERKDAYTQTTEGLVHTAEIKDDMWEPLRVILLEQNRIHEGLKSVSPLPDNTEGYAQLWVDLGRPKSVAELASNYRGKNPAAPVSAGVVPPSILSAVRQHLAMQTLFAKNTLAGSGASITQAAVLQEWKRLGSPKTDEELTEAKKRWWDK